MAGIKISVLPPIPSAAAFTDILPTVQSGVTYKVTNTQLATLFGFNTGILAPNNGGTGVNNGSSLITIGGNVTFSGAFATTMTFTGATNVTFPVSGTLATTSQLPSLPLSLANGGTGASLTANSGGVFFSTGSATAILAGTATANQVLMSGVSTTPAWSTNTYPATDAKGDLLYASASNVISGLAVGSTGNVLTVVSGLPAWTAAPASGITWVDQTSSSVTMAINHGYVTDDGATLVTYTLPTTAVLGSIVEISGFSSGGWAVAQAASQLIHFGNKTTTTGIGGSLASTNAFDSIRMVCVVANTTWNVLSSIGNITIV